MDSSDDDNNNCYFFNQCNNIRAWSALFVLDYAFLCLYVNID